MKYEPETVLVKCESDFVEFEPDLVKFEPESEDDEKDNTKKEVLGKDPLST